MASIRRTQPPANHDRLPYCNGGGAAGSRPNHPSTSVGPVSHLFAAVSSARRLFVGRPSRRANPGPWRRYFLRCLLCFLVGFLAGVFPFADFDDSALGPPDFKFDPVHPPPSVDHVDLHRRDLDVVVPVKDMEKGIGMAGVKARITISGVEAKEDEPLEEPNAAPKKLLIIVTPTYNRALQAYCLNRLGQTLRLVPQPLLWIVVEMKSASPETAEILRRSGVMYRHLVCKKKNATRIKDRGVRQRNTALQHIEQHRLDGIVYFADDDNIYSLELFEYLREIRRFGTWPVAMLAQGKNKAILEGPVCNGSQVVGWHTNEKSKRLRRFHVDMSGFAFNSTILWDPMRWNYTNSDVMRQLDTVNEGFQETTFIEQIVEDESQMEGLPNDCSKIMNWHLHIEAGNLVYPKSWEVSTHLDSVIRVR